MIPTPTAVEIAAWLGCLSFVLVIYNQAVKAKGNMFGDKTSITLSPQPLEMREVSHAATERDCKERYTILQREIEELRDQRIEDVKAASVGRKALYEKI